MTEVSITTGTNADTQRIVLSAIDKVLDDATMLANVETALLKLHGQMRLLIELSDAAAAIGGRLSLDAAAFKNTVGDQMALCHWAIDLNKLLQARLQARQPGEADAPAPSSEG